MDSPHNMELIDVLADTNFAYSDPEFRLLMACVGRALGFGDSREALGVAAEDISWPRFLWLADHHQVMPLARAGLAGACLAVPGRVQRLLETKCRTITALNLSLSAELIDLLDLFRQHAIAADPFKGPGLAVAVYGNLSERQISDLDLFVSENRFADAAELLALRGYEIEERARGVSRQQLRLRFKDVLFTRPETGFHLELHWSVAEPEFDRELSAMRVPECSRKVSLLGAEIPLHASEDLLLLLCVHGLRHRWESLKWICDVACLLRTYPDLHWGTVLQRARAISRERTVLLGVLLARDLAGLRLPEEIQTLLENDSTLPLLAAQIREGHVKIMELPAANSTAAVLGGAAVDAMRLRSREKKSDRISLFLMLLAARIRPTAEDRRCIPLPRYAAPLYWLVRPLRILRHYGLRCTLHLLRELLQAVYVTEAKP